jgi:dedicated sortase system histidine kinase
VKRGPLGRLPRLALGIRAQLLLVLTVFAVLPFLAVAYIRELEGVLRDAQERSLAGTAQAVATALHDRPRLFAAPIKLVNGHAPRDLVDAAAAGSSDADSPVNGDLEQILTGLTRTTARIRVVDRDLHVLASAGSLQRAPDETPQNFVERLLHPLYAPILRQPDENFHDDDGAMLAPRPEIAAALNGIGATERRRASEGDATIVSAAYPIWVGDNVRGAVVVEETTNAVLAARNQAFERLFTLVLAALLVGSVAVTVYATWLTSRIRRLRDDAESAIDAQGRVRRPLAGSDARDEIGDLARGMSAVLTRLSDYASYQEQMAARLSHELRTPLTVVRSSLDNLRQTPISSDANVYVERAQVGLDRLAHILTRISEAARLEQALADTERTAFDIGAVVGACVDGYRAAYPHRRIDYLPPAHLLTVKGAPELVAQMLDKLVANAIEFATADPVTVALLPANGVVELAVTDIGPLLPHEMEGRLFDSMVSVRPATRAAEPHLGFGLYVVRLIATFHGGSASATNLADRRGVVVTVTLPLA